MRRLVTLAVLVALHALIGGPLYAHHGRGATYDMKKRVTLKGTVSREEWRNPHVLIYMDVKSPDGTVVTWGFENAGVSQLAQEGYNRNTLKVGQEITAVVNPAATFSFASSISRFAPLSRAAVVSSSMPACELMR